MAYTHILTQKSNSAPNSNLWTSSEYQVVTADQADVMPVDEAADDESDDDEFDMEKGLKRAGGTYRRSNYKAPIASLRPPPPPQLRERRPTQQYQRQRQPERRNTSPSPSPAVPLRPFPSLVPNTPQNPRARPEEPSSNATVSIPPGPDRTRISDFAVAYLVSGQKSRMIYGFRVPRFRIVNVPIVVEAKRPPSRSSPLYGQGAFERRVAHFMDEGKADIGKKMSYLFEAHPSDSYIGIAFTGSWWAFTICTPNAMRENLRWSKAFFYHSYQHECAMRTIFDAAENCPKNPQEHPELVELLNRFEETGDSLTFVP
jgi:hypothetical protein